LQNLSRIPFKGDVRGNIANFMEQRVEFILSSAGHDQEIIKSVLSLALSNPLSGVIRRIEALKRFRGDDIFPDFLLAIKRVINIIPKTPLPPVKEELLSLEEEKNLHGAVMTSKEWIKPVLGDEDFYKGLKILSDMTAPINNFFDKVLVMDKQEEIKNNRLALLKEIRSLASAFADFSKLQ
jgi:glycyl-tRNA synthetase beta chain